MAYSKKTRSVYQKINLININLKTMKKSIIISLLAVSMAFAFSACNNTSPSTTTVDSKATEKAVYTCTMHPEVRSDKPGDCPKCGMALVKMETADSTQMHNHDDTMQMH
jgi:hypothetical protein